MGIAKVSAEKERVLQQVRMNFNSVDMRGNNDDEVLELIRILCPNEGERFLDLGTGSGYVAFLLARQQLKSFVDGLDVVEDMYNRNLQQCKDDNITNVQFYCYDGKRFPVEDDVYDGLIARYSLHHFPDLDYTIGEINRVLKEKSRIVICDCIPASGDKEGFIDLWMKRLGDGHVRFYPIEVYEKMLNNYGFKKRKVYYTLVKCPRSIDEGYLQLLNDSPEIATLYSPKVENQIIWLTEPVMNVCFERG